MSFFSNLFNCKLSKEKISELQLISSLFFFGLSFVGQKQAMNNGFPPITYNFYRYFVSFLFFFTIKQNFGKYIYSDMSKPESQEIEEPTNPKLSDWFKPVTLYYGFLLGLASMGGSIFQQLGLVEVSAGKTGFITGMYVLIIPIIEYCFPQLLGDSTERIEKKFDYRLILCIISSLIGLYLLSGCSTELDCISGAFGLGDLYIFIGMFFWAWSIILSDIGTKKTDALLIIGLEFGTTSFFTIFIAMAFEFEAAKWGSPSEHFAMVKQNLLPIIGVGISEAFAFGLSCLGQMYTPPTQAAVLYSLEAVSCAIFAFFLLNETLDFTQTTGAVLMFIGALIASLVSADDEDDDEEEVYKEETTHNLLHENQSSTIDDNTYNNDLSPKSYQQMYNETANETPSILHNNKNSYNKV